MFVIKPEEGTPQNPVIPTAMSGKNWAKPMTSSAQANGCVSEPRPIPQADVQAEISRLEAEHVKGLRLLIDTQADLLRIEGGMQTLRALLKAGQESAKVESSRLSSK